MDLFYLKTFCNAAKIFVFFCLLGKGSWAWAEPAALSWSAFLEGIVQTAPNAGLSKTFVAQQLAGLTPDPRLMRLDATQPERRIPFLQYRQTRADAVRIALGRREMQHHQTLLERIQRRDGVNPGTIIAIWGLESAYGKVTGHFPVIRSLATLAYQGRRTVFFRSELLLALRILQEGHVSPDRFLGEWAGGSGQPQFLPSSWLHFAVDENQDGKKDIWFTTDDVLASISNYLKGHGWIPGLIWGKQILSCPSAWMSVVRSGAIKPWSEWRAMGIQLVGGTPPPWTDGTLLHGVVPDGGPAFLVTHNFEVIRTYNRSIYYAATIGYISDALQTSMKTGGA